jgi:tRNA(fMet)-specific endonuclease VapC
LAVTSWLLDANTIVYAMNRQGGVRERANAAALNGRLLTSAIVVSELFFGAERSNRVEINRREVHATISRLSVLPFDLAAAEQLARLRAHFEAAGKRRPRIDLMIAAQAVAAGATLVSHDDDLLAHPIPGLSVEDWYTSVDT